ncbi:MAG: hypothetical protein ACTH3E_11130, partial [Psychroflexus halocasei]
VLSFPFSVVRSQLSVLSCPFSVVRSQLSVFGFQSSVIQFQLRVQVRFRISWFLVGVFDYSYNRFSNFEF